jgi:uncharacterized protein
MPKLSFEWDDKKDQNNIRKHGVSFFEAQHAFLDEQRIIAEDLDHSDEEKRYYCFDLNQEGTGVLTVRFTWRNGQIRIFGAGYWRKGKKIYEQNNSIQ